MDKKIRKFIRDNKEILLISFLLFIMPFFWFKKGEVDLGGDSSRLYFYNPYNWLKNIALYSINPLSGLGKELPNFFMIPFLALLTLLNKIGLNYSLLVPFFDGLILTLAFLSIYLIIQCLLDRKNNNETSYKLSAITAALFFTLSPILILEWDRAAYYFPQLFIYPLVILFILKFLNTDKFKFIIYTLLVTLIFSVNFSFGTAAWFFAFFPLAVLFLGLLYLHKKRLFLKFIISFPLLFILLHLFHLLPQLFSIISPESPLYQMVFSPGSKYEHGLAYFKSVVPYVRLSYNFFALPQCYLIKAFNSPLAKIIYNFGEKYLYLSLIFPAIVISSLILSKTKDKRRNDDYLLKKRQIILLLFFLITLFLMSANIGSWGRKFYESLFAIPGFSMFRTFYTKFNLIYVFFYSLLFGVSLNLILKKIKNNKIKFLIITPIISLIIYNSIPLISGKLVNQDIWLSENVKSTIKISQDFKDVIEKIKSNPLDAKYLTLPLTSESYQVFAGENGGAYFGPSAISILSGKNDFPGINSFNVDNNQIFSQAILRFLEMGQYGNLEKLLTLLNIKYIFYNNDNYIYDNFPVHPYGPPLRKIFPDQQAYQSFLNNLSFKEKYRVSHYTILENEAFLPHFYTPQQIIKGSQTITPLPQIISQPDYQMRSVIYFEEQNKERIQTINQMPDKIENTPTLEFKKINPTKYRVIVHQAKKSFPLVFSEAFYKGWEVYPVRSKSPKATAVPPKAERTSNGVYPVKYEQVERGNKFVSENFQGTIQNDNLPEGHIFETWFKKPLDEETHLIANGYANSWWLDINKIKNYIENQDGSIDFELIVEFWPQRLFYVGSFISGFTLISCLGYLIWDRRKYKINKD